MADEDLALEGDDAQVEDTGADDTTQTDDTPEPIANLARDLGWTPRDEFRGDPEKWKPAEQFIRDGRDIQRSLADQLKGIKSEVERFGRVSAQLVEDKVAERDTYWKAQFKEAVDVGDLEAADKARRELTRLETSAPQGDASVVNDWRAKNPWYDSDPAAQIRAQEVAARAAAMNKTPAEQLAAAEAIIRKEFPEHFAAPAKRPPATQTGQTRTATVTNRAKGFADMPAESQRMAKEMVARNPSVTLEAIANSYWADVAKQRRA